MRPAWQLVSIGLWILAVAAPSADAASAVLAGVAVEHFALPAHVPLAGYSRRGGAPGVGTHDPVGVRALVLQDADTTTALVSCDLLIVDERLFDAVRRRLVASDLPPDLVLLLAATHTHSGPGAYGTTYLEKLSMGHFDPHVFHLIVEQITQAIVRAYAARAPSRLAYGTAITEGLVINRVDPAGLTNREVTACVLTHEGGEVFAVVVGFAAHPTTLGAWNRQLSADYPGVLAREIERRHPGAVCLFFAGAVADQAPVKQGTGFEPAERLGGALAERVLGVLEALQPTVAEAVSGRQETIPLPPARVRWGRLTLPRFIGQRLTDDDATLTALVVGPIMFIGVPCDLAASLGQRLEDAARADGWQPVLVGFACDYIGYCIPASAYETETYEASMALNGPTTGELLVARLTQMMDELAGDQQHRTQDTGQGRR
jgi:hypothetical protein